jgi:hypothetical protein
MRKLVALALCLAASSAFAGCDRLHVRDPVMQPPPASASLPDLGSSGDSDWFREERPRELPDTRYPLVFDRRTLPAEPGSPRYWEEQPLYVAPVP